MTTNPSGSSLAVLWEQIEIFMNNLHDLCHKVCLLHFLSVIYFVLILSYFPFILMIFVFLSITIQKALFRFINNMFTVNFSMVSICNDVKLIDVINIYIYLFYGAQRNTHLKESTTTYVYILDLRIRESTVQET